MYFFLFICNIALLTSPAYGTLTSKAHFQRKKADFDQLQQMDTQRALTRNQLKQEYIQQQEKLKQKRELLKFNYIFNKEYSDSNQKAEHFFHEILTPYTPKTKNKQAFIKTQKQKQKLKKQYPTPLDVHLFSKPLTIQKSNKYF